MTTDDTLRDRFRGCLVGLAIGDALGAAAEFMQETDVRARYGRLTDYGGRPGHKGQFTDDTAMALCIARSLVECERVDLSDIAARFVHWMITDGAGIGNQTLAVLTRVQEGQEPFAASAEVWEQSRRKAAGNGGVMRCAPIALFDWNQPDALIRDSRETCRLTHPDARCEWGCVAVNTAIAALLRGEVAVADSVNAAVTGQCDELAAALARAPVVPVTEMRVDGWDQGYSIVTTQIAFAALLGGESFEEALIEVVNRGGDADTNGAVAGALLGARDGHGALPERWREGLLHSDEIVSLADSLCRLASRG
jgi:ADP-ribosyl-[dinitrogen reductase] hydrolase